MIEIPRRSVGEVMTRFPELELLVYRSTYKWLGEHLETSRAYCSCGAVYTPTAYSELGRKTAETCKQAYLEGDEELGRLTENYTTDRCLSVPHHPSCMSYGKTSPGPTDSVWSVDMGKRWSLRRVLHEVDLLDKDRLRLTRSYFRLRVTADGVEFAIHPMMVVDLGREGLASVAYYQLREDKIVRRRGMLPDEQEVSDEMEKNAAAEWSQFISPEAEGSALWQELGLGNVVGDRSAFYTVDLANYVMYQAERPELIEVARLNCPDILHECLAADDHSLFTGASLQRVFSWPTSYQEQLRGVSIRGVVALVEMDEHGRRLPERHLSWMRDEVGGQELAIPLEKAHVLVEKYGYEVEALFDYLATVEHRQAITVRLAINFLIQYREHVQKKMLNQKEWPLYPVSIKLHLDLAKLAVKVA